MKYKKSYKKLVEERGREFIAELDHSQVYAVRENGERRIRYLAATVFVVKAQFAPFSHMLYFHDFDRGHMPNGVLIEADSNSMTFKLQCSTDGSTLIDAQTLQFTPLTMAEFNEWFRDGVDPHRQYLNTIDDVYIWYLRHVPEP